MGIAIDGVMRLSRWFDRGISAIGEIKSGAIDLALIAIADEAKKAAPGRREIRRAISWKRETPNSGAVYVMHKAAASLEKGSGLHGERKAKYPIQPVNALVLGVLDIRGRKDEVKRLEGQGYPLHAFDDGTWFAVLGKKVMHPGVKATHFLSKSVVAAQPRISALTGKLFLDKTIRVY